MKLSRFWERFLKIHRNADETLAPVDEISFAFCWGCLHFPHIFIQPLLLPPPFPQRVSLFRYPNKSDKAITDVSADDLDCLIIPGGFAPDYWRRHDTFKKLTKDAFEKGIPVAAICHGMYDASQRTLFLSNAIVSCTRLFPISLSPIPPYFFLFLHSLLTGPWMLVSAGVLKGRRATCFVAIKDDVANAGATYVEGEPVVVDGNLITSRTPDDLGAFCRAILKQLLAIKAKKDASA